jgi:hypothetical protein
MKRAFWITLIAVALLILAAVGWVARLVSKPSTRETRREPSVRSDARDARLGGLGMPMSAVVPR